MVEDKKKSGPSTGRPRGRPRKQLPRTRSPSDEDDLPRDPQIDSPKNRQEREHRAAVDAIEEDREKLTASHANRNALGDFGVGPDASQERKQDPARHPNAPGSMPSGLADPRGFKNPPRSLVGLHMSPYPSLSAPINPVGLNEFLSRTFPGHGTHEYQHNPYICTDTTKHPNQSLLSTQNPDATLRAHRKKVNALLGRSGREDSGAASHETDNGLAEFDDMPEEPEEEMHPWAQSVHEHVNAGEDSQYFLAATTDFMAMERKELPDEALLGWKHGHDLLHHSREEGWTKVDGHGRVVTHRGKRIKHSMDKWEDILFLQMRPSIQRRRARRLVHNVERPMDVFQTKYRMCGQAWRCWTFAGMGSDELEAGLF